jgi:2-keto-4-pentenoate hydratase
MSEQLAAALREQHARRAEALRAGARHMGWKLGVGDRERIDGSIAVGYLTSATTHEDGGTVEIAHTEALCADVEIAVELRRTVDPGGDVAGAQGAIGGYAAALEIVDLAPVLDSPVAIVATNIFHRAVAFGRFRPRLVAAAGSAYVNDELRDTAAAPDDVAARLPAAARALASFGERMAAGDGVITGSIVQIPVACGDAVRAEVTGLGAEAEPRPDLKLGVAAQLRGEAVALRLRAIEART